MLAIDVINAATEEIGVKTAESALESEDGIICLNRLNDMMHEWTYLQLTPRFIELLAVTDEVLIDPHMASAVKYNLAIRIAPSFQRIIEPGLQGLANFTLQRLRAMQIDIGAVQFPDNLPLGSGNSCSDDITDSRFFPQNKPTNF